MQQTRFTLWAVWSALQLSLGIYAGIALLGITSGSSDPGFVNLMALGLGAIALPTAAATFVVRRRMLARPLSEGRIDPASPEGASKVVAAYVFAWVLCDAIAIWGFVLWFLSSRWDLFLPFLGAGSLLLCLHAPRAASLERAPSLEDLAAGRGTIG